MELEELKNSWNALDKRLADNEVVNLRIVKEIIAQKTKTAFDQTVGVNMWHGSTPIAFTISTTSSAEIHLE